MLSAQASSPLTAGRRRQLSRALCGARRRHWRPGARGERGERCWSAGVGGWRWSRSQGKAPPCYQAGTLQPRGRSASDVVSSMGRCEDDGGPRRRCSGAPSSSSSSPPPLTSTPPILDPPAHGVGGGQHAASLEIQQGVPSERAFPVAHRPLWRAGPRFSARALCELQASTTASGPAR